MALAWLLLFLAPHTAAAQDAQQDALARTLFDEGVTLADKHDYDGAADRFERAYSLRPSPGVAYNWAHVLIESRKLLRAQQLLLEVARSSSADAQLKSDAEAELQALSLRLPRLRVRVTGASDPSTQVTVDGTSWPRAAWDVASPIDPGAHALTLEHQGQTFAQPPLLLNEGESREAELRVPANEPPPLPVAASSVAASSASASAAPPSAERQHAPLYKSWVVWTAVGVVVGAVVVGAVLASKNDAKDEPPVAGNAMPGVLTW